MALTLQEAKVGMADHVDQQVIDEFRRSNLLMDMMVFDNAVSPGTGGSTMTYGYIQLKTPSQATKRDINGEYVAGEAKREEKTAKIAIMGGSFKVDRVLAGTSGAVDEMAFQMKQKIQATANYFSNLVINGQTSADGFDGLNKLLTSASTKVTSKVDVSTSALLDQNYNALLDEIDEFLTTLDGKPSALLMNDKMLSRLRSSARRAGYYSRTEDAFGRQVEMYNGIALIDAGKYYNGSTTVDIIPTTDNSEDTGKSDIYAVCIGLDGFHGISPTGNKIINQYLPDMSQPGAVKQGEVELLAGVVLKNTKKAGVLTGIAITPSQG